MKSRTHDNRGFSLIELIVIIVALGIMASVAVKSMPGLIEDKRRLETEREMDLLARAIVGDPGLSQNGRRSDFGYVGDIGAFPPNLQALAQNPGGYSSWRGPYLPPGFTQDSIGYRLDGWGGAYQYIGGITIASTGSGSTMVKQIADAANDYLRNHFAGFVQDAVNPHGMTVRMYIPNGSGATTTRSTAPDSSGYFVLDSLPVGTHRLIIINQAQTDTLIRYITILPRNKTATPYVCKFSG